MLLNNWIIRGVVMTGLLAGLSGGATSQEEIPVITEDPLTEDERAGPPEPVEDDFLIFIGKKISVEEVNEEERFSRKSIDGTDQIRVIAFTSPGVMASYRIMEVLHGEYPYPTIEFIARNHYGHFAFTEAEYALLYLRKRPEDAAYARYYHGTEYLKYDFDEVFPLKEGGFAGCGDPYYLLEAEGYEKVKPRPMKRFSYSPDVKYDLNDYRVSADDAEKYSSEDLAEIEADLAAEFRTPIYSLDGDIATCRMGASVEELYRIRWNAHLLPTLRYEECRQEIRYREPDIEYEDLWHKVDQCVLTKSVTDGRG